MPITDATLWAMILIALVGLVGLMIKGGRQSPAEPRRDRGQTRHHVGPPSSAAAARGTVVRAEALFIARRAGTRRDTGISEVGELAGCGAVTRRRSPGATLAPPGVSRSPFQKLGVNPPAT